MSLIRYRRFSHTRGCYPQLTISFRPRMRAEFLPPEIYAFDQFAGRERRGEVHRYIPAMQQKLCIAYNALISTGLTWGDAMPGVAIASSPSPAANGFGTLEFITSDSREPLPASIASDAAMGTHGFSNIARTRVGAR